MRVASGPGARAVASVGGGRGVTGVGSCERTGVTVGGPVTRWEDRQ